ncbi:FMN-dependent oxidoreductase, nitrilotriacetate monooxygenase family [Arboricoccus pini]|uniref:FMN-dependent oxidoreductase, nitrilotriacetate monooxygenase family n=1 Tax=Arboricoccus pini TaxID=1963835 RepID=A0A212RQR9_9PROT|nr:NtaA/DmoA family FMN-dependent monooxygenase [Arboricoccus pini]SNB74910.1 FMN-dependent oxidoreductase, nitrilotriacetate monooxygenase family [Arboricoccus pini]
MPKRMNLGFDVSYIAMDGRWRTPGSWVGRTFPDVEMYEEIARIAERGCFDLIFSGDGTGIPSTWEGSTDTAVEWGITWPRQDLNPLMVAMSRVTRHVGFGITYASTFMHPYYVARLMNSLDHITGGRMALNVVTSTRLADAANFGFDALMEHGARYDRMEEFIEVCQRLWDSVQGAMVWDRATGQVGDPAKVRPIDHEGRFFKVKGPLNTPPSPQGRPILVQAGGSPRGLKAAAQFVDVAFGENMSLDLQVRQRASLDQALLAAGRDPAGVGILWQKPLIVAETGEEARRRREALLTMIPREGAGAYLSHNSGYDFARLPPRFTLQALNEEIAASHATPVGIVHQLAHRFGASTEMTREEFLDYGLRYATHYETTEAGSAKEMADHLEEAFEATGSRGGFMIGHPVAMPRDLVDLVDFLIPELQRRGRFRHRYTGATLRETLADTLD